VTGKKHSPGVVMTSSRRFLRNWDTEIKRTLEQLCIL